MQNERRKKILELIKERGSIDIKSLSELLLTSEQNIRRDLRILVAEKKINRGYGYASISLHTEENNSIAEKNTVTVTHTKHKHYACIQAIAEKILERIHSNQAILLHDSPFTRHLVPMLETKSVSIITNSLDLINIARLYPKIQLISTGGILDEKSRCYTGFLTELMIQNIRVDDFIFEPSSIDFLTGLYHDDLSNNSVMKAMINRCRNLIVVAYDDDVFKSKTGSFVAPTRAMHVIYTTTQLNNIYTKFFKKHDIQYKKI